MGQLSEQMSAGPARIRVDVVGGEVPEHVLENMDFLNYRLADVRLEPVTLGDPDLVWERDAGATSVRYDGRMLRFEGDWAPGPLQKSIVALLALRMEEQGLHPFHSSAVHYRGRGVLFLGGESNHGKSMSQIEACRRGGRLISTETTVIDESGVAVAGSKTVFLKSRAKGTERADKASPEAGAQKFFGAEMPAMVEHLDPADMEVVIVPSIDGNYAPGTVEMIPFERQFQTLHSLQNYLHLNELLAPGWPMPLMDTDELRRRRAAFLERFCTRPYFLIRAATPQVLMDEADRVI
ncbi:MAG: hypothetical protein FJW79_03195 [Actinobacteria bacterium]|nr:hypothetical protein [Actinomycetota bacterium]